MGVREATWYTVDNAACDLTVPIVGYAVKPAGTYNVVVNLRTARLRVPLQEK